MPDVPLFLMVRMVPFQIVMGNGYKIVLLVGHADYFLSIRLTHHYS